VNTAGRAILLAAILSSGCATLFSDSHQRVTFTSNVEGAEVMLNGRPVGRTPLTHVLERDTFKDLQVTMRHPSYETQQLRVGKTLNKTAIFNLSSGCFWGTDALSGKLIEYSPDAYYVEMKPKAGGGSAPTDPWQSPPPSAANTPTGFLVVNRSDFLHDVARGDGEFLRALAEMLDVGAGAYPTFVTNLQSRLDLMAGETYPSRIIHHVRASLPPT
jgi:hypothetical protein